MAAARIADTDATSLSCVHCENAVHIGTEPTGKEVRVHRIRMILCNECITRSCQQCHGQTKLVCSKCDKAYCADHLTKSGDEHICRTCNRANKDLTNGEEIIDSIATDGEVMHVPNQ